MLLHPGRSRAARESAATHTGTMAGNYEVMRVLVERQGRGARCADRRGVAADRSSSLDGFRRGPDAGGSEGGDLIDQLPWVLRPR